HTSWTVALEKSGQISFTVQDTAGRTSKIMTSSSIYDLAAHRIEVRYSANLGQVQILIDGKVRGSGRITGPTKNAQSWGLSLGNPFSTTFSGL
ncbi:hypothetical protein NL462_26845, partial [Klebsiella pneumoniae]|nr:hypothetical protein [Klebsiella pneumoniae]